MNTIVRLDPFNEFRRLASLFEEGAPNVNLTSPRLMPIDVFEDNGTFVVRASVPGIRPDELEVVVEKDILTLRGEHRNEIKKEDSKFYRQEVNYGAFSRSIRLPETVNVKKAEAMHEDGVVTVRFPFMEEVKPKALTIPVRKAKELPAEKN